jgi:hypothetical protein
MQLMIMQGENAGTGPPESEAVKEGGARLVFLADNRSKVQLILHAFPVASSGKRPAECISGMDEATKRITVWYSIVDNNFREVGQERKIEISSNASIKDLLRDLEIAMPWLIDFDSVLEIHPDSGGKSISGFCLVKKYSSTPQKPLRLMIPSTREALQAKMIGNYCAD